MADSLHAAPSGGSPSPASEDRLDFRRILPIFVIVFVDLMGVTIIIPLLPLYAAAFGADAFVIGALNAAYPLMQFVGGPLLGGLSDRYGRKPVLIVSQIGTLIGFLLLAAANALPILFLSRMIDGLSGGNVATAQAALTDSTGPRTRAQALGLVGAAFGLGFIIGPVITAVSLALSNDNYRVPALIAAAFSLVSILLTVFLFRETLTERVTGGIAARTANIPGRMKAAITNPLVGLLILLTFLQQTVFSGFTSLFAPLMLTRLGMGGTENAVFFVVIGVVIVAVQGGMIGPLSRRYGERRLIIAGLTLLAVGLTLLALVPRQPPPGYSRAALEEEIRGAGQAAPVGEGAAPALSIEPPPDTAERGWLGVAAVLAAIIPLSIGSAMFQPSLNSLITRRVSAREVGSILGVTWAFLSAANTLGPLAGGTLFELLGPAAPFLVAGASVAALVLLAARRIRPLPGEANGPA